MRLITSRVHPVLKQVRHYHESSHARRKSGVNLLDGAHLVAALLDSGRTPLHLLIEQSALDRPEIQALLARVPEAIVLLVADALFSELAATQSPQGVLAVAASITGRLPVHGVQLLVLCEGVQDPGNVGAIIRAAAAAGASHVLLSPDCAFAWSPRVVRASQGAHFSLEIVEGVAAVEYVQQAPSTLGVATMALDAHLAPSLYRADLTQPLLLIVGSEGNGISAAMRSAVMARMHIPMPGKIESLNVAQASAIALFECVRQRI